MPERFQRKCNEPGCTIRTNDRTGYCEAHRHRNTRARLVADYDKRRHDDPISKLYATLQWRRLKQLLRNRGNVICQKLVDGKQCCWPVEIHHHIISPRVDVSKMFDPHNIVGLCRQHHPNLEGTPDWIAGRDYVATVWKEIYVGGNQNA